MPSLGDKDICIQAVIPVTQRPWYRHDDYVSKPLIKVRKHEIGVAIHAYTQLLLY